MSGEPAGEADPRQAIFERLAAGGPPITEGSGAWGHRTWLAHEGEVWLFGANDRGLRDLRRQPSHRDLPPAIVSYLEANDAALAADRAARARALLDRLRASLEALDGGRWLRIREGSWMIWAERVGYALVSRGELWPRRDPTLELAQALAADEALGPTEPPAEEGAHVGATLGALYAELAALEGGDRVLGSLGEGSQGEKRAVILSRAGRWLRVWLDPARRLDESALFNPYAAVMEEERVVRWILEGLSRGERRGEALHPVPEGLQEDLPALDRSFSLPKARIVDRYIEKLRGGGYLSGGPTTDQSWTIEADGEGGFRIGSYEGELPDLRRVWAPISEEEIRRMVGSYAMFGLHRLEG